MKMRVWCRFVLEGFHSAPAECNLAEAYLHSAHRHMFHFRVDVDVSGHNREVEFILLRRQCMLEAAEAMRSLAPHFSCEHLAAWLLEKIPGVVMVEVSEDGENGATASC